MLLKYWYQIAAGCESLQRRKSVRSSNRTCAVVKNAWQQQEQQRVRQQIVLTSQSPQLRGAVGNHLRENRSGREKLEVDPKTKEVDTFITVAMCNWELVFAHARNKRECQHLSMSKLITHMLRHQEFFQEDDGDVQWRKVMDNLRREEQARDWNHQDQQRALSYSTDKPQSDVCKIDGELTHIRAVHGHSGKPSVGPSYFDMRVIPKHIGRTLSSAP